MALFEPNRNALWRFVRAMHRSTADAEDLMSDTILQAWQHFDGLRDDRAFLSFLFTIASRLYRRQRWRRKWFGEYDETSAQALPQPGMAVDDRVDVQLLRLALQKLPERQREAVVLFELLGLRLDEVQAIQGGSLSGVKSRLVRGRATLARLLDVEAVHTSVDQPPASSETPAASDTPALRIAHTLNSLP